MDENGEGAMDEGVLQEERFAGLAALWPALRERDRRMVGRLLDLDQGHLFEAWSASDATESDKRAMLDRLREVDESYPGGLVAYVENARRLLAEAKAGTNPFEGFVPERPDIVDLSRFDETYVRYEADGMPFFDKTAFVLVAGGLGERLGYPGIKLDIAVETLECTTYLRHYADCLLALERRMAVPRPAPFIIMVSPDTAAGTLASLEANDWFGLRREQVRILRQSPVPALADNEAHLAMDAPCRLALKPHGHGDVHVLLHASGEAERLLAEGYEYLVFMQDTNGQTFNTVPGALGVSARHEYDFNSLAIVRVPGEAVGGIARLKRPDGREMTVNVEYNQLDPLLRATVDPAGDVAGPDGLSPFPGNCNTLVVRLEPYAKVLRRTKGVIAEFVNPKYVDASRSAFRKPTRLETMMQDLPKLFEDGERVGVTLFDRSWSFSPDKNNPADAAGKHAAGAPADAAATAESDFYRAGRVRLRAAGGHAKELPERIVLGVPFVPGPKIILRPSFAMTLAEGDEKLHDCRLSDEAALIVEGEDVRLEGVELSGTSALVVKAVPGAKVTVRGRFENSGFAFVELSEEERGKESPLPEYVKMRGYRFEDRGVARFVFDEPGEYVVLPPGAS